MIFAVIASLFWGNWGANAGSTECSPLMMSRCRWKRKRREGRDELIGWYEAMTDLEYKKFWRREKKEFMVTMTWRWWLLCFIFLKIFVLDGGVSRREMWCRFGESWIYVNIGNTSLIRSWLLPKWFGERFMVYHGMHVHAKTNPVVSKWRSSYKVISPKSGSILNYQMKSWRFLYICSTNRTGTSILKKEVDHLSRPS